MHTQQTDKRTCSQCGQPISSASRFCPWCGTAQRNTAGEVVVADNRRLRVAQDTLSLRGLLTIVESSVTLWQQRLQSGDAVTRQHAAQAIQELSRILESLAQQLAMGRETVKITRRLPTQRIYTVACAVCGHGNRENARFCQSCGATLAPASTPPRVARRLQLQVASSSDMGQVRDHNEDSCFAAVLTTVKDTPIWLLLIADGMGGTRKGDEASQMARDIVRDELLTELRRGVPTTNEAWQALLRSIVQGANGQLHRKARASADHAGMGTTLTMLVVVAKQAHLAHVGDSRAYLCNAQGVTDEGDTTLQLTIDHSLVARLVDIGQLTPAQARVHPQRNIIYRALGTNASVDVDTLSQPVGSGDVLLLCSDGLTNHVNDAELGAIALSAAEPLQACQQLLDLANQRGGSDNISVVIGLASRD